MLFTSYATILLAKVTTFWFRMRAHKLYFAILSYRISNNQLVQLT